MGHDFVDKLIHASPEAKLILIVLGLLSIISWAVIGWKLVHVKRAEREVHRFLNLFRKAKDLAQVHEAGRQMNYSPIGALVEVAQREVYQLRKLVTGETRLKGEFDPTVMIRDTLLMALERTVAERAEVLRRHLVFLATATMVSPFLGLLGTVWGIMIAFLDIAARGSANISVVAPGIADALITTIAGLAVAIPAVVGYNYLSNRIRIIVDSCENFSLELTGLIYKSSLNF